MNEFLPRLIIFVLVIGALYWFFPDAERDETGAIVSEGDLGTESLRMGDCFNNPSLSDLEGSETKDVATVSAIPCALPHDFEIYALSDRLFDQSNYPGEEVITLTANEYCVIEFEKFIGINTQDSILSFVFMFPTKDAWDLGNRLTTCAVDHSLGKKLEGSSRGSGI
ncbi:MAG: septum formation family protein [Gammaproteobacteria bacterium]|nr:septum formation family protein [Gammaproteobacteria bacterium]